MRFIETILQDLRYSLRTLLKSPGFTLVAVLTLSLGIGANTGIFSMIDWLLLRPLPVKDAGQLAYLVARPADDNYNNGFSYLNFLDIRDRTRSVFSHVAGVQIMQQDGLTVNGASTPIWTNYVTGDFFNLLGIRPALGRFILPSEGKTAGGDPVLVISYAYWQSRFSADPAIVGRNVEVNGRPVTIIGVAPKGFTGPIALLETQGYLPLGMAVGNIADQKNFLTDRGSVSMFILARLKPGVTLAQAQPLLDAIAKQLAREYPTTDNWKSLRASALTSAPPHANPVNPIHPTAALFLCFAALVLLLACVNLAGLLLVRAGIRGREMAVRSALGAARSRLMRQLLTDSLVLALAGCAGGVLIGIAASQALDSFPVGAGVPVHLDFAFSWRVYAYAVVAALGTGIAVGLIPALRGSRANAADFLRESSRSASARTHRLRSALVVAEIGGSLTLLIVAGLFVRSLRRVQHTDLGFDPRGVLNLTMDPHAAGLNPHQGRRFFDDLLDRLRALSGVEAASIDGTTPMSDEHYGSPIAIDGAPVRRGERLPQAQYDAVSPGYFATMKIPLLRGRDFLRSDNETAQRVAIINEEMARRDWPNQDPIGRHFVLQEDPAHAVQVIGIAGDSRTTSLSDPIGRMFYVPFAQRYIQPATVMVRVTGSDPAALAPVVLQIIRSIEPAMPVFGVETMNATLDGLNGLGLYRMGAWLAGAMGVLGLLLAILGVYGVVSYSASERTHEIGIRMALGARPQAILKMMILRGVVMVGAGVIIGILLAAGVSQSIASLLVGIAPLDPITFVGASLVLGSIALAACYIPARRATRVDPLVSLRHD
ncbi:MAG TPA: ABC transporter permease [Bryobacteraceae bacterium]|nr:ABC transporter permease [Bryobacteraceae bacterium]